MAIADHGTGRGAGAPRALVTIPAVDVRQPTPLLGGLSPSSFMRRHWQKRPLLVRGALADAMPGFAPATLFAIAAAEGAESRLVRREGPTWTLRHGPLPRRALPPLARRGWSVLVQGIDLHDDRARALLDRFRFVPDARLDDVMVSYASDGGGVGPHVDSYDVFLLQIAGKRRWRIARPGPRVLRDGAPLALLARFRAEEAWTLEAGDMLYLPPGWAHEGTAVGACMTASIGFRAPTLASLGAELVQRLADGADPRAPSPRYRDVRQTASAAPARIPPSLVAFAGDAVRRLAGDRAVRAEALGTWLSEPKADTWFDPAPGARVRDGDGARLDRRTRLLHDARMLYANGEAVVATGRDGRALRRLADRRALDAAAVRALGPQTRALLDGWCAAGWLHAEPPAP
jgi:50S ribosomal protein L16 3-hydroxylase